jgi:hypothetical protein
MSMHISSETGLPKRSATANAVPRAALSGVGQRPGTGLVAQSGRDDLAVPPDAKAGDGSSTIARTFRGAPPRLLAVRRAS